MRPDLYRYAIQSWQISAAPMWAGWIHTIDDVDDEISDRIHRMLDILVAIRAGKGNARTIQRRLRFFLPKTLFISDCEELADRGLVAIRHNSTQRIYAVDEEYKAVKVY